jgi:hypothetical protein
MGGVTDARRDVQLTADEVAMVLRRAAELEALAEGPGIHDERYDARAVEEAATEVGLSQAAVRQAVAELRVGSLGDPHTDGIGRRSPARGTPAVPGDRAGIGGAGVPARARTDGRLARRAGRPGRPGLPGRTRAPASPIVAEQRAVAVPPDTALAVLDGVLRRQMFEARRRGADRTVYRPRTDMAAKLRRKLDFNGSLFLLDVVSVTTVATPTDEGALVRVEAELAVTRSAVVGSSAATGAAITLVGGLGGALLAEPAFVLAAVPAGAAVGAGALRVRGRRWDAARRDVNDALTVLLDRV